jgi:hypothetical protein
VSIFEARQAAADRFETATRFGRIPRLAEIASHSHIPEGMVGPGWLKAGNVHETKLNDVITSCRYQ